VGTMSELRPGRDTTLPSAQHIGTGHPPPLKATTRDTHGVNSNLSFSLPGSRDADDEYSPITNDSSGRDSELDQTNNAGLSPQARPVHGKTACQACVSGTGVCRGDI
jgi:hypothetical protein